MWGSTDGGTPEVTLETSMGAVSVEMYYRHAPKTCRNFVELARRGYYDNVIFHRIIKVSPEFPISISLCKVGILQEPAEVASPSMGEQAKFEDEIKTELKHTGAGILSMANAGPNTNGSQFFITLAPCQSLDGKHTIFGRVCRGMEIVKRLGSVQTDKNDRPIHEVKILRAVVKD
ncbi:Peptidyl-prolyl cis-trans isomerase CYP18-2 [Zea mays]|uniref:Peptidyl-prolyl cis-trans isomerase n=2 Tax=Zea mays TaxID=4577 RepID=A0A1D6KMF6_MAIZE|nr:Peptidyl-prolyl cis-trans isomerase CYP18-2 [Zea mays]